MIERIEVPYRVGDVWEQMAAMEDGSVDLVLTSPPFLALRSYLPPDHPDKAKEIGSEPTPAEFLDTLLALTAEWGRLVGDGTIAVELGDTYAGSGGAGGDYNPGGWREGQGKAAGSAKWDRSAGRRAPGGQPYADTFKGGGPGGTGWPLAKSLCFIPQLYGASLAYGRNLLRTEPTGRQVLEWIDALRSTGISAERALVIAGSMVVEHYDDHTFEPWRVRNVVRWVRPNPPVGRLGDKFRPATSEMIVATKCQGRWFDLDAVRTPSQDTRPRNTNGPKNAAADGAEVLGHYDTRTTNEAGAPPLDWWEIPTSPYKGAHYATWPPALCERPIKSMCPERVCRTCGKASERITARTDDDGREVETKGGDRLERKGRATVEQATGKHMQFSPTETVGWSDCGHDDWRPGVVLDPFAGSGTTLAVATGLGRAAIGVDLDDRNVDLARERCRMTRWVDDAGAVFWTTRRGKNHLLWAGDQTVGGKVADAVWKNPDVTKIAKKYGLTMNGIVTLRTED